MITMTMMIMLMLSKETQNRARNRARRQFSDDGLVETLDDYDDDRNHDDGPPTCNSEKTDPSTMYDI